jgi:hypothetical protein
VLLRFVARLLAAFVLAAWICAPRSSAAQSWRLSPAPVLTISADADSNAEFTGIAGLARLASGEIIVVQGSPAELRLFSSTGKFVRRLARNGSGPGEMLNPWWFGHTGDSLFISDVALSRITVWDVPRGVVSTIVSAPRGAPSRMIVSGRLARGPWLVVSLPRLFSEQHADGPFRDSTVLGYWAGDTALVRIVGQFPNIPYFGYNKSRFGAAPGAGLDRLTPISSFVAAGDRLWIGDPGSDDLLVYDTAATRPARVRVPLAHAPFSPAAVRRTRDRILATAKRALDSARTMAMFDLATRPRNAPAFSRLLPGVNSGVWIEAYRAARDEATEYVAIDATGRVTGRFRGPAAVRFLEIGSDYALGVHRDTNDVDSVVLYRILR